MNRPTRFDDGKSWPPTFSKTALGWLIFLAVSLVYRAWNHTLRSDDWFDAATMATTFQVTMLFFRYRDHLRQRHKPI